MSIPFMGPLAIVLSVAESLESQLGQCLLTHFETVSATEVMYVVRKYPVKTA